MPDLDIVTANGRAASSRCCTKPARCCSTSMRPAAFDITPWADRVQLIDAKYVGTWDLPVLGLVIAPTAVLIRPDGYVAWVADQAQHGLAGRAEPSGSDRLLVNALQVAMRTRGRRFNALTPAGRCSSPANSTKWRQRLCATRRCTIFRVSRALLKPGVTGNIWRSASSTSSPPVASGLAVKLPAPVVRPAAGAGWIRSPPTCDHGARTAWRSG